MRLSVPIVLFLGSPRPITQHLPLPGHHFYQLDCLLHRRSGRVVPKREQVEPAPEVLPPVASVPLQEKLEEAMHLVDGLHGVPFVREALGLRGRMDFPGSAAGGDRLVAGRPVVDEARSLRNALGIGRHRALGRGLAHAAEFDRAPFAVGRRRYAELVSRKPALRVPGAVPGLPCRDVLLVDPDPAPEGDPVPDAVDGQEQLGDAVKPGGIGVHVRLRGRGGTVELEQMVQEFDGLGNRYLFRVEDGPGQRAELPAAVRVQAFVYADSGLFAEPVLPESGGPAMGARFGDDRVDEGDLLPGPAPMLFVEPFDDGLVGERTQFRGCRRKRRYRGLGFLLHVWRFRRKRGRRPKPPSLEKAPARLRALDADSFGSAPPLNSGRPIYPSRANLSFERKPRNVISATRI